MMDYYNIHNVLSMVPGTEQSAQCIIAIKIGLKCRRGGEVSREMSQTLGGVCSLSSWAGSGSLWVSYPKGSSQRWIAPCNLQRKRIETVFDNWKYFFNLISKLL